MDGKDGSYPVEAAETLNEKRRKMKIILVCVIWLRIKTMFKEICYHSFWRLGVGGLDRNKQQNAY